MAKPAIEVTVPRIKKPDIVALNLEPFSYWYKRAKGGPPTEDSVLIIPDALPAVISDPIDSLVRIFNRLRKTAPNTKIADNMETYVRGR